MDALTGARILVTGATGFIGSHLVNRLRKERLARLVLVSRHRPSTRSQVETSIAADLRQLSSTTWNELSVPAFDIVFHLGALTPKSKTTPLNPSDVVNTNVQGTLRLLDSLSPRPQRFIFASAVDVFAPSSGIIREFSPVTNSGLYATSKLMGEALVSDWAHQTSCSAVIARIGHLYGPGEKDYEKAIPTFIRAALNSFPLTIHGDGSVLRDLFYIDDVIEALMRAATYPKDEVSSILILGSHHSVSVAEIAQQIVTIVGNGTPIHFDSRREPGNSTRLNTEKMNRLLGSWNRVRLSEGLVAEVEYFKRLASK